VLHIPLPLQSFWPLQHMFVPELAGCGTATAGVASHIPVLQPPLPLQSFWPLHPFRSVLQPPLPLQSFLPLQQLDAPATLAICASLPPLAGRAPRGRGAGPAGSARGPPGPRAPPSPPPPPRPRRSPGGRRPPPPLVAGPRPATREARHEPRRGQQR